MVLAYVCAVKMDWRPDIERLRHGRSEVLRLSVLVACRSYRGVNVPCVASQTAAEHWDVKQISTLGGSAERGEAAAA